MDWAEAESSARNPEDRNFIQQLRRIERLGQIFREQGEAQSQAGLEEPGVDLRATSPSPATGLNVLAAGEPKSWRHLKIRGALGGGAFGTVFRAWEPRLDREVALKLLHHLDSAAEDAVVEEASLLARVHHPNVVAILGADRSEGCAGLWMELINGRTLKEIQDQSGPCSAEEATVYGLDVCRALAAVHLAGLVHRDVKAQNVMREAGGRVVLMDFGAAATGTGSGTTIRGTPYYLAPEVLQGEAPTVQSDLYSLGVLLFYLVSGDFPVRGNSLDSLREEHRHGRRRLLRDLRPDLSAAFVRMVDAALSARREERPATAGAMEALLESTLGRDSVASRAGSGPAPQPSGRAQQSVAVLRFVNMTVDKNLEFFCDGVAEEIINALTTVPGLRVMPAASAFRFTSGVADLREVGARLDVGTVLEGSLRVSGDRIRVISRLISTGRRLPVVVATIRTAAWRDLRHPGRDCHGDGQRHRCSVGRRRGSRRHGCRDDACRRWQRLPPDRVPHS